MAVDTSKLRKPGRRGLGVPPTDGSPGMEENSAPAVEPSFLRLEHKDGQAATEVVLADEPSHLEAESAAPELALKQAIAPRLNGAGDGDLAPEPDAGDKPELAPVPRGVPTTVRRSREEHVEPQLRERVPPPDAEPRIPFTTRVSASTKERLEDACHFLRKKHQDFINEAIIAHLKKHGF